MRRIAIALCVGMFGLAGSVGGASAGGPAKKTKVKAGAYDLAQAAQAGALNQAMRAATGGMAPSSLSLGTPEAVTYGVNVPNFTFHPPDDLTALQFVPTYISKLPADVANFDPSQYQLSTDQSSALAQAQSAMNQALVNLGVTNLKAAVYVQAAKNDLARNTEGAPPIVDPDVATAAQMVDGSTGLNYSYFVLTKYGNYSEVVDTTFADHVAAENTAYSAVKGYVTLVQSITQPGSPSSAAPNDSGSP